MPSGIIKKIGPVFRQAQVLKLLEAGGFLETSTCALIAIFFSIFIEILICFKNRNMKTYAAKVIARAEREGYFVTGRCIWKKYYTHVDSVNDGWEYKAKYEYFINHRRYVCKRHFRKGLTPPAEITLYYSPNRPKKVYAHGFDKLGVRYGLLMFSPVLTFLVVFCFLWASLALSR